MGAIFRLYGAWIAGQCGDRVCSLLKKRLLDHLLIREGLAYLSPVHLLFCQGMYLYFELQIFFELQQPIAHHYLVNRIGNSGYRVRFRSIA